MNSALLILVLTVAACERGSSDGVAQTDQANQAAAHTQRVAFDSTAIEVRTANDTYPLTVEVAATNAQRTFGLMDRDSLAPDAGMIFLYDDMQSPQSGFWMYRTRIPLDIAFFDGAGRIVAILGMEPCTSLNRDRCQTYAPNAAYYGALEMNRGWFAQRGVRVGDRIVMPGHFGEG